MVKPATGKPAEKSDFQFKGVRKRTWGKWVSEIRRPNCRERIWLGSYDTAEKAARAFDAALFCLRGKKAKFNFPENLPQIDAGSKLSPSEIQAIAARFANEAVTPPDTSTEKSCSRSETSSVSDELLPAVDYEVGMDWSFLDLLTASDSVSGGSDFSSFSSLDDFSGEFFAPTPAVWSDLGEENGGGDFGQQSFLWSF